jgi:hypothetical protein
MSIRRRSIGGTGAAVLIAVSALVVVTSRDDGAGRFTRNRHSAPGTPPPRQAAPAPPRRSWAVEANRVCMLGRKLYPSIAVGANADPDTMDYAVNRLVDEIEAITSSPPERGRLLRDGLATTAAWRSLATRPIRTVAFSERQQAAQTAARYVDQLVLLGATACRVLRPDSA